MCVDPISAGLTLASAAFSSFGNWQQGKAAQANAEAEQARMNRQAQLEAVAGNYQLERTRRQNDILIDENRSSFLTSGVAIEGSANDVIADTATQASLDEQSILYSTRLRTDAARFAADAAKGQAEQAGKSAVFGAVAPFLNAATSLYGDFRTEKTALRAQAGALDSEATRTAASRSMIAQESAATQGLAMEGFEASSGLSAQQFGRTSGLIDRTAAATRRLNARRSQQNRAMISNPFGAY